ncbi:MAG: hypothetical protein Q4D51_02150 [Eubacteriales bacterium]|nr:hypothetical protein [Eubacteriales bacterium]
MKSKIIKSKKNANIYEMFEDKIEVKTGRDTKVILLPKDFGDNRICFYDMFYDSGNKKLRVIVACRKDWDEQYVIDEDELVLTEKAPFK